MNVLFSLLFLGWSQNLLSLSSRNPNRKRLMLIMKKSDLYFFLTVMLCIFILLNWKYLANQNGVVAISAGWVYWFGLIIQNIIYLIMLLGFLSFYKKKQKLMGTKKKDSPKND
jgi:hypothetical protein